MLSDDVRCMLIWNQRSSVSSITKDRTIAPTGPRCASVKDVDMRPSVLTR